MMTGANPAKRRLVRLVGGAAALVALLSVAILVTWMVKPSDSAPAAAMPDMSSLEEIQRGFTWIAETIKPSVVFIEVEQKPGQSARTEEDQTFDLPERWREFFGPGGPFRSPGPEPQTPSFGQGSGVIIDPAGLILTNNHVVRDAAKVTVHLANGESYGAEVLGADPLTDLAVIKVDPKRPLTAARLGNADNAKVGMWVVAVGYPFGGRGVGRDGAGGGRFDEPLRYEPTVTVGVISATRRQLESDIPGRPFRDLIQTDAPINPGNSGGPLVNIRGEVIGINQAIFTSGTTGGNIGVGFAIPVNAGTTSVIAKLREGEPVVRGRLGVAIEALTEPLKQVYEVESGVFVSDVEENSPASAAGIKPEDVITKYNGEEITSQEQFVTLVQTTKPGSVVGIEVIREGKSQALRVTIGELAPQVAAAKPSPPERKKLGLVIETVPSSQAAEMHLEGGVRVRGVEPLGDGARAGLQIGDVIVTINRQAVSDVASYDRVVDSLKKGDPAVIRVWRPNPRNPATGQTITAQINSLSE
jgi:serine protease Do